MRVAAGWISFSRRNICASCAHLCCQPLFSIRHSPACRAGHGTGRPFRIRRRRDLLLRLGRLRRQVVDEKRPSEVREVVSQAYAEAVRRDRGEHLMSPSRKRCNVVRAAPATRVAACVPAGRRDRRPARRRSLSERSLGCSRMRSCCTVRDQSPKKGTSNVHSPIRPRVLFLRGSG